MKDDSIDLRAQATSELLKKLEDARRVQSRAYAQLFCYSVSNIALLVALLPLGNAYLGMLIGIALCALTAAILSTWWRPKNGSW